MTDDEIFEPAKYQHINVGVELTKAASERGIFERVPKMVTFHKHDALMNNCARFFTYNAYRAGYLAGYHASQPTLAPDFAETCEYCDKPKNSPNYAYHVCTGRKAGNA